MECKENQPTLTLTVPFKNSTEASIAYNALRIDKEPDRSAVIKTLSVQDNSLVLNLEGPEVRQLRHSVNSFFDHVMLVQKVVDKFSLDKYPNVTA